MTTALFEKPDIDLTQIINGVEIMAPSPFGIHQRILYNLTLEIGIYLRSNPIGTLYTAPLDVILEEKINRVQPDLIFKLPEDAESIEEINDTEEKFEIYQKYGVSEYWLVFPEQQCIEVYTLDNSCYSLYCSTAERLPKFKTEIQTSESFFHLSKYSLTGVEASLG